MFFFVITFLLAIGLFLGMVFLMEFGRRKGAQRIAMDPEGARAGFGTIDGAILALLGLLIAFTFSGAAFRFDARRQMVVEETNAIGTAYLRLDLLPPESQPPIRDLFRRYVDSRIETYRKLPDLAAAKKEIAHSSELQAKIWKMTVDSCLSSKNPQIAIILLPALNQMFDITTSRTMAAQLHPPYIIFFMLGLLALISSFLAGYGMAAAKTPSWIHIFGYALVMAMTFFVILDIEYPRFGLIRVDEFDQALVQLRQSWK